MTNGEVCSCNADVDALGDGDEGGAAKEGVSGCNADVDALGDGDEGGAVKEGVSGCKPDENSCGWGPDRPEALAEGSPEEGAAAGMGSKNLLSSEWSLGAPL